VMSDRNFLVIGRSFAVDGTNRGRRARLRVGIAGNAGRPGAYFLRGIVERGARVRPAPQPGDGDAPTRAAEGKAAAHSRPEFSNERSRLAAGVRLFAAPLLARRYRHAANPKRTATYPRPAPRRRIRASAPSCRYRGSSGPRRSP